MNRRHRNAELTYTMTRERGARVREHHGLHGLASWGLSEILNLSHREWLIDLSLLFFFPSLPHSILFWLSWLFPQPFSCDLYTVWRTSSPLHEDYEVTKEQSGVRALCSTVRFSADIIIPLLTPSQQCWTNTTHTEFYTVPTTDKTRLRFDSLTILTRIFLCLLLSHDPAHAKQKKRAYFSSTFDHS
jgi:hypothetical protein